MIDRLGIVRFLRYGSVGVGTFLLDLFLLYMLIDYFLIDYLFAAALSFGIAVSINYVLSRMWIFHGTEQTIERGYMNFLFFAGVGMLLTMGGMYLCVSIIQFPVLFSRILVAGFVGVWNYLMNLHWNFQVAGKHEERSFP